MGWFELVARRTPRRCSRYEVVGYASDLFENDRHSVDMELIANIVGLVVVAMIAALVIAVSNKYSRRRMAASPAMGKLNVPCDPDLHTDFLNALTGEKIQFVPPTQSESAPVQYSNNAQDASICVVLVAEQDHARAEQILVGFQRKWFSRDERRT
jgi:hypothetical protein